MKKVGITGGIGSGKSTVCKIFETLGIPVYSADDRAKSLMQNDPKLKEDISNAFGKDSYLNNQLNTSYLAKKVFCDEKETLKINALVHPAVGRDFQNWLSQQNSPYVIKEAALMIESGSYRQLDYLINVFAPIEIRIERTKTRDPQRSVDEINAIISKQVSEDERSALADIVINNDDSHLLIPQVLTVHNQLVKS